MKSVRLKAASGRFVSIFPVQLTGSTAQSAEITVQLQEATVLFSESMSNDERQPFSYERQPFNQESSRFSYGVRVSNHHNPLFPEFMVGDGAAAVEKAKCMVT
jgi:hypothetical protein